MIENRSPQDEAGPAGARRAHDRTRPAGTTTSRRYGESVEELSTEGAVSWRRWVVGRTRILRTRAKFDCPWSVAGVADVDEELVDLDKLQRWLAVGGRRVGLGDWRPQTSGHYGRFDVKGRDQAAGRGLRPALPR